MKILLNLSRVISSVARVQRLAFRYDSTILGGIVLEHRLSINVKQVLRSNLECTLIIAICQHNYCSNFYSCRASTELLVHLVVLHDTSVTCK